MLKIAAQMVVRKMPGVPLVGHETVEDGQADQLPLARLIFQGPRQRRNMSERSLLCQEASDFQLGVDPILDMTENFQNQAITKNDGCIALRGFQRCRLWQRLGRT